MLGDKNDAFSTNFALGCLNDWIGGTLVFGKKTFKALDPDDDYEITDLANDYIGDNITINTLDDDYESYDEDDYDYDDYNWGTYTGEDEDDDD